MERKDKDASPADLQDANAKERGQIGKMTTTSDKPLLPAAGFPSKGHQGQFAEALGGFSTAAATTVPPQLTENRFDGPLIRPKGWLLILALGALFVTFHWHFIYRMYKIATHEWGGNWSHALIVPLISGYFVYQNAHRLAQTPARVYWPGLVVLFGGMFSFAWGIYPGRNDMLQGYSMILALLGLVLFLLGPKMMRVLWFPILYLGLAVKISDRYWEQIAWYLQLVAARSSTVLLQLIGIDTSVEGSTIELMFMRNGQWLTEKLNVAEACSGLRMLMAFIALGAAMAYLVERPWWHRLLMLGLTVPIAVMVNVGRVTTLGLLTIYKKELASGDFHVFVGILMLIPAAGLFWLVGWILDHIIIRGEDESPQRQASEHRAANTSRVTVMAGPDIKRRQTSIGPCCRMCINSINRDRIWLDLGDVTT